MKIGALKILDMSKAQAGSFSPTTPLLFAGVDLSDHVTFALQSANANLYGCETSRFVHPFLNDFNQRKLCRTCPIDFA
jgi:hypothetical protein